MSTNSNILNAVNAVTGSTAKKSVSAADSISALMAQLETANRINAEQAAKIAALEASKRNQLSVKIAEFGKGSVSVSGLNGPFPLSLYANQWESLIKFVPTVQAFIDSHKEEIRSASYAHEFATLAFEKRLGRKWDGKTKPTESDKAVFTEFWAMGYKQALVDPTILSTDMKKRLGR